MSELPDRIAETNRAAEEDPLFAIRQTLRASIHSRASQADTLAHHAQLTVQRMVERGQTETEDFTRANLVEIKQLAVGLVTLSPVVPAEVAPEFFMHLFLLSVLIAYFPFSKLVHMGGVFLSPTRNLVNNNRMKRHVNPWNAPVPVHTYEEWEEEFRDKLIASGLPLERQ